MRELLSRRTPEQTLDALEANALRAVRALGAELTPRATAEEKEGRFYGGSVARRDRILGELFAVLTGEETGRPLAVTAEDVLRAAKAEAAVEAFLEGQGVPEEERWFPDPGLLAQVLAEVPGAMWSPRVLRALDMIGAPSPDGPSIVVFPGRDGHCIARNIGTRAVTFAEWLGFSSRGGAGRGKSLEPISTDAAWQSGLRAVGRALKSLVVSPGLGDPSKDWRPASVRVDFLVSFLEEKSGRWNYKAFGRVTKMEVSAAAFRKCWERTLREALQEVARL